MLKVVLHSILVWGLDDHKKGSDNLEKTKMHHKNSLKWQKFFREYSKNVDRADSQYFWKLSDDIISAIITRHLPSSFRCKSVILDAGGGTGRAMDRKT